MKKTNFPDLGLRFATLLLAGILLAIDLFFSSMQTAGLLYHAIFALVLWIPGRHHSRMLAMTCTAFIVIGYLGHHGTSMHQADLLLRAFSILSIWSMNAFISRKSKLAETFEKRKNRLDALIDERTQSERNDFKVQLSQRDQIINEKDQELSTLRQVQKTLIQEKEEAEAAAKVRTKWVSAIGSQLQSPVRGINSMAGMLEQTTLDYEQQDYLDTIRQAGHTLSSTIDTILDFNDLDQNQIEFQVQPFVLRGCVEEACDMVALRAAEQDIELTYHLAPGLPTTFMGDGGRIRQIIATLLENAIAFSKQPTLSVNIEALEEQDGNALYIVIQGDRVGMPEAHAERLANLLSSTTKLLPVTDSTEELALSIAARICTLMNGRIWITPPHEAIKDVFRMAVKLEPATLQQPAFSIKPWFKNKTILVVDDNERTCSWLATELKAWGIRAITIGSAAEAMQWFAAGNLCDALLLDFNMPEIDGLTFARQIVQQHATLPIMLLSTFGERVTDEALAGSMAKPIKQKQLYYRLSAMLNRNQPPEAKKTTPHSLEIYRDDPAGNGIENRGASQWLSKLIDAEDLDEAGL